MTENVSLEDDLELSDFEHYIETKVEVRETYKQVYDENEDTFYVSKSDFENVKDAREKHICSCGEEFQDRDRAHEHLQDASKN